MEDLEKQIGSDNDQANQGSMLSKIRLRLQYVLEAMAVFLTNWARAINRPLKSSQIFKILVLLITSYALVMVVVYSMLGSTQDPLGQIFDMFGSQSQSTSDAASDAGKASGDDSRLAATNTSLATGSATTEESDGRYNGKAIVKELLAKPTSEMYEFHWEDWLDLSLTEDPAIYDLIPDPTIKDLDSVPFPPRAGQPELGLSAIGKLYIKHKMVNPNRVVVLGKKYATYNVKSSPEKQHHDYGQKELMDALAESGDSDSLSAEKIAHYAIDSPLIPALKSGTSLEDQITVELPEDVFQFNTEAIKKKGDKESANPMDIKHANMVSKALENVKNSGKHFNECPIKGKNAGLGGHYDWRFFNTARAEKEHEMFMHHMIRAWSNFVEQEGLMAWIAHGSLMGWWWNGMAMPWDSDNDVQMPIMEFDRFAKFYNGTLVVEDPEEGTGRYYIDISPWYVERTRGNGKNLIDARFIDIRSGIYIDITGLAFTGERENHVQCKNRHFYKRSWLSPARKSLYEGVRTFIPNAFESVLQDEYHKFKSAVFGDWMFKRALALWVPKNKCLDFDETSKFFDENNQLSLYGACNSERILDEFDKTRAVTSAHMDEMDIYRSLPLLEEDGTILFEDSDRSRSYLAKVISGYYPPLRGDPSFEPVDQKAT